MINMEEMIILNREILARTTPIQILILVGLWLPVFFTLWKITQERTQEKYKILFVWLMLSGAHGITADIARNNRMGKQVERIEVIGYFEDFQKKIENRGYEVVERRGDIVVLEREYKQ